MTEREAVEEPVRFFHGTRAGFGKGGWVFPRTFHQGEGTSAPLQPGRQAPSDAERYVYITTSEDLAWVYAWHAPGRGRPRVLVVEPRSEVADDPEHSPLMQAYRCEVAKVLAVRFTPTVSEKDAREGWATG